MWRRIRSALAQMNHQSQRRWWQDNDLSGIIGASDNCRRFANSELQLTASWQNKLWRPRWRVGEPHDELSNAQRVRLLCWKQKFYCRYFSAINSLAHFLISYHFSLLKTQQQLRLQYPSLTINTTSADRSMFSQQPKSKKEIHNAPLSKPLVERNSDTMIP